MTSNKQRGETAAKKSAEEVEREGELLRERSDTLRFEFIASELDLAVTFCDGAASTSDPEKRARNLAQAEKAYQSAKHFLEGQRLSEPMHRTIQGKVSALESLLRKARERTTER